jgi:hypothetical protein
VALTAERCRHEVAIIGAFAANDPSSTGREIGSG